MHASRTVSQKFKNRLPLRKILIIILSSFIVSCQPNNKTDKADYDKEFASGSIIEMPELTDELIDNLALLGKTWGFLKYHHPEIGKRKYDRDEELFQFYHTEVEKGKYDWDDELFQFLPEFMNVNDTRQRDESLLRWINKYGELPACTTCKETATDAYQKPDFSWLENGKMSAVLKEKIN